MLRSPRIARKIRYSGVTQTSSISSCTSKRRHLPLYFDYHALNVTRISLDCLETIQKMSYGSDAAMVMCRNISSMRSSAGRLKNTLSKSNKKDVWNGSSTTRNDIFLPSQFNCQTFQRRSYIFLPSSWKEMSRILQNLFKSTTTSPKQKLIHNRQKKLMIKLRDTGERTMLKLRSSHERQILKYKAYKCRTKQNFIVWKISKKQGITDRYNDLKINLRKRLQYTKSKIRGGKMMKQQWNHRARLLLSKANIKMIAARNSGESLWNRLNYRVRIKKSFIEDGEKKTMRNLLYSRYSVTLDEPFRKEWFDADGYPLTSRDPLTGRFVNPWSSESSNGSKSLSDVWKWKKLRMTSIDPRLSRDHDEEPSQLLHELSQNSLNNPSSLTPPSAHDKIKLTWIGHATMIVQMADFIVLTDPIFSHKSSPFQFGENIEFLGVPRYYPPSMYEQDLPDEIDICLISHDHYDHLDHGTIRSLVQSRRVTNWVVPLGIKSWLKGCDVPEDNIFELEWWESATFSKTQHDGVNKIKVTCAPAQHWSSRTPFDRNKRLWASWALHAILPNEDKLSFYFAGDTGYPENFPLHRLIGDRLGPFDLAAIPIGAYAPRFFMRESHCNPSESVKIHGDIRSKRSVAMHWGTFPLADEPCHEPPILLRDAIKVHEKKQRDYVSLNEYARGSQSNPIASRNIDFIAIPHGASIESEGKRKQKMVKKVKKRKEVKMNHIVPTLAIAPEPCTISGW